MGIRSSLGIIDFEVELKDEGVLSCDDVKLTIDALLLPDGSSLDAELFSVWKRDPKGNRVRLSAIKAASHRYLVIAPDSITNTWCTATDSEKEYGAICNDDGTMPDGTAGYRIF